MKPPQSGRKTHSHQVKRMREIAEGWKALTWYADAFHIKSCSDRSVVSMILINEMFVNTSDTLNSRTTPLSEFWETMNSYRLVMFNEGKSVPPLLGMTKKYNHVLLHMHVLYIIHFIILRVPGYQDSAREVMCPWQPFFSEGKQRFHPCGWIWWFFKVSNDGIVFVHFKKKTVTSWLGIGWRSLLGGFCFPGFSDWVWCIQLRLTLYLRIDVQYISGVPQMHWQSPPGSLHFLVGNPYKRYWYAS